MDFNDDFFSDKPKAGTSDFLTLKAGEEVVGVFHGEVKGFWKHFKGPICKGRNECEECAKGGQASKKFQINFITKGSEGYVIKKWERGITEGKALGALSQDYDLRNHLFKIRRTGSGKDDTVYSIIPMPNGNLPEELKTFISNIKNVSEAFQKTEKTDFSKGDYKPVEDSKFSTDDIPF